MTIQSLPSGADARPLERAYVHPAELVVGSRLQAVMVLGSCVAICVVDLTAGIGGVAHVVLPAPPDEAEPQRARYAGGAVDAVVEALISRGARLRRLEAKLFGGATLAPTAARPSIGDRNVQAARTRLAELQIPVRFADVGGSRARRLELLVDRCEGTVRFVGGQ